MYSPWLYGPYSRGPNPFLVAMRAQKQAQTSNIQNVILCKQVVDLTKQNIDLKRKLREMNTQSINNSKDDYKNIGYSRQIQAKAQYQSKRQQPTRIAKREQRNPQVRQMRYSISFGSLHRNAKSNDNLKIQKQKQRQRQRAQSVNNYANQRQRERSISPIRKISKKYQYLRQQTIKTNQNEGQTRKTHTIIQNLDESKMNPQGGNGIYKFNSNNNSNITKIESIPKNEYEVASPQSRKNNKKIVKDNRVYLQYDDPAANSPLNLLKSVKKLNDSQIDQAIKSTNRKQYLHIVGNVQQKNENTNSNQIKDNQKQSRNQISRS